MKEKKKIINDLLYNLIEDVNRYILGYPYYTTKIVSGKEVLTTKTDYRPWLKPALIYRFKILDEKLKKIHLSTTEENSIEMLRKILKIENKNKR